MQSDMMGMLFREPWAYADDEVGHRHVVEALMAGKQTNSETSQGWWLGNLHVLTKFLLNCRLVDSFIYFQILVKSRFLPPPTTLYHPWELTPQPPSELAASQRLC